MQLSSPTFAALLIVKLATSCVTPLSTLIPISSFSPLQLLASTMAFFVIVAETKQTVEKLVAMLL